MASYGSKIREIREAEGLDRDVFAEKIGITKGSLKNLENDIRRPGVDIIEAIATHWPQYLRWLMRDETRPEHGDVSPEQEKARRDSARDGKHVA